MLTVSIPSIEIPSERNWFLMQSPSLSSPTDEKTDTSSPHEFNPLAICAAAPGDSSERKIFKTGTGAVEISLLEYP